MELVNLEKNDTMLENCVLELNYSPDTIQSIFIVDCFLYFELLSLIMSDTIPSGDIRKSLITLKYPIGFTRYFTNTILKNNDT
jgi:hypothetical protein